MGPTKVIGKGATNCEAKTGKIIKDGPTTPEVLQDYANHHYIALPVVNKAYEPWLLDGEPIYCLQGTRYENLNTEGTLNGKKVLERSFAPLASRCETWPAHCH